jgi:3-phenylpropionate/trans-cinnamate dioxygenase ferredoxin reductase subunit
MSADPILIVGAGQSAAMAALSLRDNGWRRRIVMVGREHHQPYERPPLSKALLVEVEEPRLQVVSEDAWARADVEFSSGTEVLSLDLAQRQAVLSTGQRVVYDKCLLATGGQARSLPCVPAAHPRVHVLRTLDDARKLRAALQHEPHVAILGGGFLGLEIAHSALARGAQVTVIERAATLLDRFLPAEVSGWLEAELRAAGARLLLNTSVAEFHAAADHSFRLVTEDGASIDVDEVVVAVGLVPNDELARNAGLAIAAGGGVRVDAHCRTSDENVFACGDCASQPRTPGAAPSRLESWQNANEQARAAAAAMLGLPLPAAPVPWFWTDQGAHNLQILGSPAADLAYVRRGDPGAGKALWVGHRAGTPVHAVAVNAGAELRALRPLLELARPVALQDFPLASVNLRAWVKQQLADAVIAL